MTLPDKQKVGIFLAALYILLQPLMLQNPLKPVLSHGLGSLQIADVLFPFMLLWMVWWLWGAVRSGNLRASMLEHRAVFVAAVILGVAALSSNRSKWISLMAIPMLMAALAIQVLTVWHIDMAHLALDCGAEYAIERQSQYFGWYGDPTMCRFSLDSGITYSSYFLMKLVALKAWLSQPLFGIGIYQYEHEWVAAAGVDIQSYFKNYPFTMAQSTYLTLLAEVGLLGFTAWFGLMGLFLGRIWGVLCQERSMRWMFLSWGACFFYALIDLDVQNFRFLYSLMPLAAALSIHAVSQHCFNARR